MDGGAARAQGDGGRDARGDGFPGGDGRGVGGVAVSDEAQELVDEGLVRAAVGGVRALRVLGPEGEVGLGPVAGAAPVPDLDDRRVSSMPSPRFSMRPSSPMTV